MSSAIRPSPTVVQAQLPGFELPARSRAILGAEVGEFINRYGSPYEVDGRPPNMLYFWDVVEDYRVAVIVDDDGVPEPHRRVICITLIEPPNKVRVDGRMTDKWASGFMQRYHPVDASWIRDQVTAHGQSGWFIGFDRLYWSYWLGETLPANYFKNRAGEPAQIGSFDLQCVYELGTKFVSSVTLAVGSVMLDEVRAGQPG